VKKPLNKAAVFLPREEPRDLHNVSADSRYHVTARVRAILLSR
jgi:hypothetical protein